MPFQLTSEGNTHVSLADLIQYVWFVRGADSVNTDRGDCDGCRDPLHLDNVF